MLTYVGVERLRSTECLLGCECLCRVFLLSVRLSGGWPNRCCRWGYSGPWRPGRTVLARTSICEAQAAQPDLILELREQGFHLLPLPQCLGELWRVRQLPCALARWFVLIDDQAAESGAGFMAGGRRFKSSLPDQQLSYIPFRNLRSHPSFAFELDDRSKRVMACSRQLRSKDAVRRRNSVRTRVPQVPLSSQRLLHVYGK